jgi:hypothetical protein
VDDQETPGGKHKYRGRVFGGDNEDFLIVGDLRGYLYVVFLEANSLFVSV